MAITRINNGAATEVHTGNGSLAYPNTLTAGSFLIVAVSEVDNTSLPTVSGTQNGSFGSPILHLWSTAGGQGFGIWAIPNTKGAVSETINVTTSGSEFGILIEEFTGIATSSYVDGTGAIRDYDAGYATNATLTSGTFSTSANGDLVFSAVVSVDSSGNTTGLAIGSGFTIGCVNPLSTKPFGWFGDEYLVQSTASSSTASTFAQTGGPTDFIVACVAFKAAPSGSTVNITTGSLSLAVEPLHTNVSKFMTHSSLAFSTSLLHTNVSTLLSHSTLTFSPSSLHINNIINITHQALSFVGESLHINVVLAILHAALSFTGQTLHITLGSIITITKATLTFAAQSLHVNVVWNIVMQPLIFSAQSLHSNYVLPITKQALNFTTNLLHTNVLIDISAAALTLVGKGISGFGNIITITCATLSFIGQSLHIPLSGVVWVIKSSKRYIGRGRWRSRS